MTADDDDQAASRASVVRFPFSRVTPVHSVAQEGESFGEFARIFGMPREQTTGHWCSRCHKIWYGYLLEVTCPTCGNRHG
jgi:Zn finger protein HypA/HybF involved in hydrogenase expression